MEKTINKNGQEIVNLYAIQYYSQIDIIIEFDDGKEGKIPLKELEKLLNYNVKIEGKLKRKYYALEITDY